MLGSDKWAVPYQRVGVLLYGLIRSDAMLSLTAPSIDEYVLAPLGNSALTFVHAYCTPPQCSVNHSTVTLQGLSTRVVAVSLTTLTRSFPSPSLPRSGQPDGCRQHVRQGLPGTHTAWSNEYAGFWSLRSTLRASELVTPPVDTLLVLRIDTRFLPPALDMLTNRPWEHTDRIFVPNMQHFGAINDRFSYGAREVMRDYIEARWRRMHAPALRGSEFDPPLHEKLAEAWKLTEYPDCIIGERLACWYATTHNRSIGFSSVRFVRVRADLYSPDVDQAIANRSIPLRSWFHLHANLCPSLACSGGALNAPNGSLLGAVCAVVMKKNLVMANATMPL